MKRLTLIVMAGLLMLGLTQCKKEQTNTNAEGEQVYITVKVDEGDRHIVYPGTGAVQYTDGDKIYVGNGGHYVGTLTYGSGAFSGNIIEPTAGQYLYFYFIGGEYTGSLTASTTSFDWSIADQSEKLPVLSYGHSTQKYTDGNATYGCTLENQCALVEFSLTNAAETVSVGGMLTGATVDFATPGITPTEGATPGSITLYSSSSSDSKWAILLPQDAVTGAAVTIEGSSNDYIANVPDIEANEYIHGTGNAVAIYNPVFTVDADGTTVHFAPGNLQYHCTSHTWRFAENQWDCIGAANENISSSYNGWIDLFCWGTGAEPLKGHDVLSYVETFVDWGTNAIYNPKIGTNDAANTWRTLEYGEWKYLLGDDDDPDASCRTNATNLRKWRTVNEVYGLVIMPDGFDYSTTSLDSDWNVLETAGAVFLPAAGTRLGGGFGELGDAGYYWSASPIDDSDRAWSYDFDANGVYHGEYSYRYYGSSVRLVR